MLEQAVVLEADSTKATEYSTSHEMVGVRTKPVNDVVVIPNIDLGDLSVGRCKRLGRIPSHVVFKIVLVALISQIFAKWIVSSLPRIGDCCPFLQRALNTNRVIVDLITSSDHDMERALLVGSQDVVPESGAWEHSLLVRGLIEFHCVGNSTDLTRSLRLYRLKIRYMNGTLYA